MSIDMPTAMSMFCEVILKPNLSPSDSEPYNAALVRLISAYRERYKLNELEAEELLSRVMGEWTKIYYDSDGSR